jgi:uncharacterized protein (DUF58 family)
MEKNYLDLPSLQTLKGMRFVAKKIVEGLYSGKHRSRKLGQSVEFADYRAYIAGDDLRNFDWKVFARSKKEMIRTYHEETNMRCTLVVDTSASMLFGSDKLKPRQKLTNYSQLAKLDYARYLAAALAYMIVDSQDQVGLALMGEKVEKYMPPFSTRFHLDSLLSELETLPQSKGTKLKEGMEHLFQISKKKGVIVVISDFLEDSLEDLFQVFKAFKHRRFEIALFNMVHPNELKLPEGRSFNFVDAETGATLKARPSEVAFGYEEALATHFKKLRQLALGTGCEYTQINTSEAHDKVLLSYLQMRERLA